MQTSGRTTGPRSPRTPSFLPALAALCLPRARPSLARRQKRMPRLMPCSLSMLPGVGNGRRHMTMELQCLSSLKWNWIAVHVIFKCRRWCRVSGCCLRLLGQQVWGEEEGLLGEACRRSYTVGVQDTSPWPENPHWSTQQLLRGKSTWRGQAAGTRPGLGEPRRCCVPPGPIPGPCGGLCKKTVHGFGPWPLAGLQGKPCKLFSLSYQLFFTPCYWSPSGFYL